VQLLNRAVSDVSGQEVAFTADGSTGDHVQGLTSSAVDPDKNKVQVETAALDDVIANLTHDESVYIAKIDVQGFETNVMKGLKGALAAGKVRYVLFEYWVDAIDEMQNQPYGSCTAVSNILSLLVSSGYTLFDLQVQAHPKSLVDMTHHHKQNFYRALDFWDNCKWYSDRGDLERAEAKGGWSMGVWADVLAVYGGEFSNVEMGDLGVVGHAPRKP